ncbi:MAG: translation initiation factor IF-1 [Mycoplasmataceae bacterium]|nr:translation initiation factor IF-1 [Mycoplasmataceae bacterium]
MFAVRNFNMTNDNTIKLEALVVDKRPKGAYLLKTDEHSLEVVAHVSGKMRQKHIRIFPGDKVLVEIGANDLTHGRIVYSLRKKPTNTLNVKK